VTQPDAAPAPERGGRSTALTIALLGGACVTAFEAYGTLTAMPAAAEDLGSLELYAWAFTAFLMAQVLAIVLAGRWVDRMGPVIPLGVGSGIFVLGLVAAGAAPSMEWLLAARFLQGFGGGALNLSFMVVVAQAYGARERASLMSVLSFCWVLPSFIGPPVSAWITTQFSWHWVFWGVAPVMVVIMLIGYAPLRELNARHIQPEAPTDPVPVWAAVAGAVGAALIQLAGQRLDWLGLIAGVCGVVALLAGLPRLMPSGFIRFATGLPSVMAARGLACGAFFASESFAPLLLTDVYAFDLSQAGLFLALGATGWTIGSVVQAQRWLRLRRDQIIALGAVAVGAGAGIMGLGAWLTLHWIVTAVGFTTAGLGMGLLVSSTSLANMQVSEPHQIGRNTSSLQVAEGLGNSVVTGIAGSIFAALHTRLDASGTFTPIYLMTALMGALAFVMALRVGPVRNESAGVG